MRILRHETGHAIENAYRLRRRRRRQQLFGKTSQPYPQHYAPKPYSKRYVLHLEAYYAQSHPDEDFAETFAVWLTPNSSWRRRYTGLARAAQARVRGRADARAGRPRGPPSPRAASSIRCARCARRCASTTATSAPATASTACASTTPRCALVFSTPEGVRRLSDRVELPAQRPAAAASQGRGADRRAPLHDRPRAGRHDRARRRAAAPPDALRRADHARLRDRADEPAHALRAQRPAPGGPMKKLRLLALMDESARAARRA